MRNKSIIQTFVPAWSDGTVKIISAVDNSSNLRKLFVKYGSCSNMGDWFQFSLLSQMQACSTKFSKNDIFLGYLDDVGGVRIIKLIKSNGETYDFQNNLQGYPVVANTYLKAVNLGINPKINKESSYTVDKIEYRGFKIQLNAYPKLGNVYGYSIYEGNSDKYILSTKGPAGSYEKALNSAKEIIDRRIARLGQSSSYVASKPYIGSKQSSYLGEGMLPQEKKENIKNAFAVIGALFIAFMIYVYVMEFKNSQ